MAEEAADVVSNVHTRSKYAEFFSVFPSVCCLLSSRKTSAVVGKPGRTVTRSWSAPTPVAWWKMRRDKLEQRWTQSKCRHKFPGIVVLQSFISWNRNQRVCKMHRVSSPTNTFTPPQLQKHGHGGLQASWSGVLLGSYWDGTTWSYKALKRL